LKKVKFFTFPIKIESSSESANILFIYFLQVVIRFSYSYTIFLKHCFNQGKDRFQGDLKFGNHKKV
jgi:hypothetical protein